MEIGKSIENEEQIISKLIIAETINVLYYKLKTNKKTIQRIYEKLKKEYTIVEDSHLYDKTLHKMMESTKRLPFFDNVFMTLMEDLGNCIIR